LDGLHEERGTPKTPQGNITVTQRSTEQRPSVIVIDDDDDIREELGSLLGSVGFQFQLFGSVADFLKTELPDRPTCVVSDVRMPGQSGLELQRALSDGAKRQVPIVFITAHGDIPMCVRAMKGGAIEFLTKPFRDQDLLDAIAIGHTRDKAWLTNERELADLLRCYDSLTPREREVMNLVVSGRLNKQIAAELAIAEITVKVHRGQVMRKMHAPSLPALARMSDKLQLSISDLTLRGHAS
jgi:FixJ family two-component response regulator